MNPGTKTPFLATVAALLAGGTQGRPRKAMSLVVSPSTIPLRSNRPPVGWRKVASRRRYKEVMRRRRRNAAN